MQASTVKSLIIINLCAAVVGGVIFMQPLSSASHKNVSTPVGEKRMPVVVYHVCKKSEWKKAQQSGSYMASQGKDQFVHLSTWKQLPRTLKKFFKGQDDLTLLEIEYASVHDKTKWEGKTILYPHYYGDIPATSIIRAHDLPMKKDGNHKIPTDIHHQ